MKKIQYATTEQQIEKLKSQHLLIQNEENAKIALQSFGYTNVIKGYREPYMMVNPNGEKIYRSGVTFEQIFSLYLFDKALRNAIMASMQDLEEHVKEITADVIAKSFGTSQNDYLQFRNYQNKRKRNQRFSLSAIIGIMKNTLDTNKEPIHYYMENYGIVPPWILFKSVYFSTIINFIDLLKAPEKQKIAERLYHNNVHTLPTEALTKLMMDTLYICLDYRNRAAHGGRMYNYNSDKRLRVNEIFGKETNINGISKLLALLDIFDYKNPVQRLEIILQNELNRHCMNFSQDVTFLGQILNMDITQQQVAYVTNKSDKYHLIPYCSGIKDATQILLEDALKEGYVPCKRCAK